MTILDKPIAEIDASNVRLLCEEQQPEGSQFEIKRDLPSKDGKPTDNTAIGDYARNELAKEIVAFANTYGGTMVVGVAESSDKPSRATGINPLPNCADLARRLRQSVYDIVDPPLPLLECSGIVTEEDGTSGVVVMRAGRSRRAPHRSSATREVYVRREDESVRIDMREIQELTVSRLAEVHAVDEEIARRREQFRETFQLFGHPNACGLHYVALPTTSVDLGRVVKRPEVYARPTRVDVFLDDRLLEKTDWRLGEFANWRPALRAVDAIEGRDDREIRFLLTTGGLCEFMVMIGKPDFARFYAPWFASSMGVMLNWIDRIRREGGFADQEYVIAPTFIARGKTGLEPYGDRSFSDGTTIPEGPHIFPIYPVGLRDGFNDLIARFNEDFWNAAHVAPASFAFKLQEA